MWSHDREVVGDEEVGEAQLLLEVLEEVEDLGLDGDVEGRDGLVADDELRVEGEGAGDADALALAAGELVGVARMAVGGRGPTRSSRAATRSSRSLPGRCLWTANGSPTMSPTVMRGLREE